MQTLPANLPSIAAAKLPRSYEAARIALAECSKIDECRDWADRAEAMASYAKQAKDDALETLAIRIRARAIRRCGELLRTIEPAQGANQNIRGGAPPKVTRTSAARDAGLSRDQKREALRLARVPEAEFEAAIEQARPPTAAQLADRGKLPPPLDVLHGRDPADYRTTTEALGHVRRFLEFVEAMDVQAIVRGASARERRMLLEQSQRIGRPLATLLKTLRRAIA